MTPPLPEPSAASAAAELEHLPEKCLHFSGKNMFAQESTAICLTPDRRFFGPALFTASRIICCGLPAQIKVLLVCEEEDIWPGYDKLDPQLRERLELIVTSFKPFTSGLPRTNGESTAVYRRLVLDRILPSKYSRIIAVDADIDVKREGLAPLASVDLAGAPIAAAIDMIFLMDFGGHLASHFKAYRGKLGLALTTPYFNNGLIVIDRNAWEREELGGRALSFIKANREKCEFYDQSALNALLKGRFAPLSPRFNFMGDFLLLDLEREFAPVAYHFVNRPKPWERGFTGDPRFAETYRQWFSASPWPNFAAPATTRFNPPAVNAAFRARLLDFLRRQNFIDSKASEVV
jgi:lipopolysaccharide biosynthesis glycosyltransferase